MNFISFYELLNAGSVKKGFIVKNPRIVKVRGREATGVRRYDERM